MQSPHRLSLSYTRIHLICNTPPPLICGFKTIVSQPVYPLSPQKDREQAPWCHDTHKQSRSLSSHPQQVILPTVCQTHKETQMSHKGIGFTVMPLPKQTLLKFNQGHVQLSNVVKIDKHSKISPLNHSRMAHSSDREFSHHVKYWHFESSWPSHTVVKGILWGQYLIWRCANDGSCVLDMLSWYWKPKRS